MNKVIIESRKAQLKAMHEVMCNANDEGLYMTWISLGVPDCPTEDDFEFIAESDETYNETIDLFIKLVSKASYRS